MDKRLLITLLQSLCALGGGFMAGTAIAFATEGDTLMMLVCFVVVMMNAIAYFGLERFK